MRCISLGIACRASDLPEGSARAVKRKMNLVVSPTERLLRFVIPGEKPREARLDPDSRLPECREVLTRLKLARRPE